MSRRFRSLTFDRALALPSPCTACAFWESVRKCDAHCAGCSDEELLRAWFERVRKEWGGCGRVAYEDREALGFVKYAPPAFFPQVDYFSVGRPSDDAVLLACLHLRDEARHIGLGAVLLGAALRDLASRGVKAVEAYGAVEPAEDTPMISVNFLLKQGFVVTRPNPVAPLMRMELEAAVAWTDNLEAVLESLRIPRLVRSGIPQAAEGGKR